MFSLDDLHNSGERDYFPAPPIAVKTPPDTYTPFDVLVGILLALFSCWLMWHTFSYYPDQNALGIARKVWSDFASHIPLIRSFSLGDNWPPEYPLYPGEPIRYHFLFYFLVGKLEQLGLRIDYALNILSAIGFFLMTYLTYRISLLVYPSRRVATLAIIFLLFNGSLTFIRYLTKQGLSLASIAAIPKLKEFVSFAPWGDGDIAAFWSLTIFTNQRHLAWGYFIALLVLHRTLLYKRNSNTNGLANDPYGAALLHGTLISLLPFFHQPTLLLVAIIMAVCFLLVPIARFYLLLTGIFAFLPVLYQTTALLGVGGDTNTGRGITWHPGYMAPEPITLAGLTEYWFHNIGLHLVLAPVGALLAGIEGLLLFILVAIFFGLGNCFQFAIEMAANHKLFNFAIILAGILTALMLVRAWDGASKLCPKVCAAGCMIKQGIVLAVLALTASGIIELMPIVNDAPYPLPDMTPGGTAAWIRDNTPKGATFLNSSYTYHPASLAGRKIFQGWLYFTWSNGYPDRVDKMRYFYTLRDPQLMCAFLQANDIDYFTVEEVHNDPNLPDISSAYYALHFEPSFRDPNGRMAVYGRGAVCG